MPVIEARNLTKEYQLGAMQGFKQTLLNTAARLTGKNVEELPLFKALDDVSFSIEQGEVVGIIGHNGAGKSTLLKMLAKISTPTRGSVKVNGRIAPLIEVGAGFVPNFTGRENVYLNGAILGMSRKEIDKKFDEIVDFAEMAEFIDTPVKRYSSGMQVKLAFAVATSVDAEILIVDEVLAVGDLAFQRKCFDRMEEFIKGSDRTVLLVSHNIRQVERICSRVIMMDHGRVLADDMPLKVSDLYYRQSNERIENFHQTQGARRPVQSTGEVDLVSIDVLDEQGQVTNSIPSGGTLRVRAKLNFNRHLERPEIIVGTHTTDFFYLSASSTATLENQPDLEIGSHEFEYIVSSFPLVSGQYGVRCAVFDQNRRNIFAGESLKTFNVLAPPLEVREPPARKLNLQTQWRVDGKACKALANTSPELAANLDSFQ